MPAGHPALNSDVRLVRGWPPVAFSLPEAGRVHSTT